MKEGIKFHNGRSVTAGDVVFAINRLAAKATGSDLSFLLEKVLGFDQVNKLGTAGELEGIRQIDESNIEVRISTPWVEFPSVLTHPATAPIPRDEYLADPEGFLAKPIGSGPYAYSETVPQGGNVRLAATEGSSKGPAIKKVSFLVYPSVSGAFRDFERRAIDIAEVPAGGSRSLRGFRNSAGFVPLAAMLHLAFNLRSPKLIDPRLREAISLAIDRPTLRQIVYSNTLVSAGGLVPAGLPGRSSEPCGNRCELNLTRARELVTEAYAGQSPPEIMYDFPEGDRDRAAAEAIKENLSAIGVTLTPRSHDLPAYVELLQRGAQEMFRLGWIAEFPATDWFVSPLFRTGSPDNTTGFSLAEVDGLIDRARSEGDQTKRDGLYRQIENRVMADMPVIPLGQFQSHFAARDIEGFYVDSLGSFELNQMHAN